MIFLKRLRTILNHNIEVQFLLLDKSYKYLIIITFSNKIYILSPLSLIQHILTFKSQFQTTKNWQLPTLPCIKQIPTSLYSSIIGIEFANLKKHDLCLVIAYYSGEVQVYRTSDWKIIRSFKSVQCLTGFVVNKKGMMYTIDYGKDVRCFSLESGNIEMYKFRSDVNWLHYSERGMLYETVDRYLVNERQEIVLRCEVEGSFATKVNSLTNSEEINKYFELDFSREYVIVREEKYIYCLSTKQRVSIKHQYNILEISPFKYKTGKIVVYSNETNIFVCDLKTQKEYVVVENLTRKLQIIKWVGPYQLLLVDVEDKMSYLEIFNQNLVL